MITYLLQVTICWALFLGLYHISLRKETFFKVNRAYLIITILLGLIIPRITWDTSMFMQQASVESVIDFMTLSLDQIATVTAESETSLLGAISLGVYLTGVLFMTIKLGLGILKIHKLKLSGDIQYIGQQKIVHTAKDHAPFTFFGTIFLSQKREDEDKDPAILIHESAHVSGWHTIDVLFVELVKSFFWFNPLIYGYDHALKTIHEYIADANVLERTALQRYGRLLLRQAQPGLEIALANHFYNHQLKKRFKMMTRTPSQKRMLLKYFSIAPFILIISLVFTNQRVQAEIEKVEEINFNEIIDSDHANSLPEIKQDTLPSSREIFKVVEVMPEFPGGKQAMFQAIFKNMKYPIKAFQEKKQGMNVISFVVEPDGSMSNIELVRDAGFGMGEESMRIAKLINEKYKWKAGLQRGKAVAVQMTLPLKFKLAEDEKEIKNDAKPKIHQSHSLELKETEGQAIHIDTDISIDPRTPEEEIENDRNDINPGVHVNHMEAELSDKDFDIDTIITFNPETFEETIQIVRSLKEEIVQVAEEMPEFPGGKKAIFNYIFTNLKYPSLARDNKVEGMAVVSFVIEKDGSMSSMKILRDPGAGTGTESLRVVEKMAKEFKWSPAKQNDKIVRVQYSLPIRFKLDNDVKEDIQLKSDSKKSPLIVVYDNKENELTRSTVHLAKDKLMNINPDEIERINVLKNEAANKAFGPSGDNGVIQIFLKNGPIKHPNAVKNKTTVPPKELQMDGISIFPNPTSNIINVRIDELEKDARIILYTMDGKTIFNRRQYANASGVQESFDVSNVAEGMIVVAIVQGDNVFTNLVIKQ